MKKSLKKSLVLAITSLASVGALSGCGGGEEEENLNYFAFSIGMNSGASIIEKDSTRAEYIKVYDNGVDTAGRSYTYSSTKPGVATIDQDGRIHPVGTGKVNFRVKENASGRIATLTKDIEVIATPAETNGGYNYSGGSTDEELAKRAEILGKLEKYAMDTHLTGITLFDNGGYVRYSDRVKLPTTQYIEGYGYGLLGEGSLDPSKPLTGADGQKYPTFLHESIAQDSLKINQYTATGSQVSDLASYITGSYWSTRLSGQDAYEWYPQLATDKVYKPIVDASGAVTGFEDTLKPNKEPIPMEVDPGTHLFKKWRVYVKTDGVNGEVMKYHAPEASSLHDAFDNRGITIADYEFAYKLLFTQSNTLIRGTEMANDTSYGIKGAQRFFNETSTELSRTALNEKWDQFKNKGLLGIKTGNDKNGDYIDLELVNAIDSFTAMYTLSSSLVSPLPEDLFYGPIASTLKESAQKYGTFNNGENNAILNYTLSVGPYRLTEWEKTKKIIFERNNDWFEYADYEKRDIRQRYLIPGIYFNVLDTSTDTEKTWKQLEAGNLDSAGVPSKKVKEWKDSDSVKATKGDSTFKLNVNSLTQSEWDEIFWGGNKYENVKKADAHYTVKPWMSNSSFLDGLFYSINRKEFAEKRGVTPSINYFSDAYMMRNAEHGSSYNKTQAHLDAVSGYETITNGESDYGYNLDKAIDSFRIAVKELSDKNLITLGPDDKNPTEIDIQIMWMYQTDPDEYGNDIKYYFESAFNNPAVCGGRVKLNVKQDYVTNWEDVYNVYMMQGRYDLGFGAISGNTYNPLNFMEVLKSDNSSNFTLNWGNDTGKIDPNHPLEYDGKKWSFDALWEVADHGGIVKKGEKVDAVKSCYAGTPTKLEGSGVELNLYNGFNLEIPVEFTDFNEEGAVKPEFGFSRLDLYIENYGPYSITDNPACYDKANHKIVISVSKETAQDINSIIKNKNGFKDTDKDEWHKNPFIASQLNSLFSFELTYTIDIGGTISEGYCEVAKGQ